MRKLFPYILIAVTTVLLICLVVGVYRKRIKALEVKKAGVILSAKPYTVLKKQ